MMINQSKSRWQYLNTISLSAAFLMMAGDEQTYLLDRDWLSKKWVTDQNGERLALSQYKLTFNEEFDRLDCVEGRFGKPSGSHKWYSYGKFGYAAFVPCGSSADSPIRVDQGVLTITLSKRNGKWQSGSLATLSPSGEGFKQRHGVFSARIRLPVLRHGDLAVWPAFWLLARYTKPGSAYSYSEMDIMENFGGDQGAFHSTLYEWPPKPLIPGQIRAKRAKRLDVPISIFDGKWHTYTASWTSDWWSIYVDDVLVGKIQSQPDQTLPMYPIVDLALIKSPNGEAEGRTYSLDVDWIKVYAKRHRSSERR